MFIDIPAHQSHRNFFAISTRTNHFEALKNTFEYKNLHPVVLSKWIKEFKISEDNPIESLETALETFTGEKRDDRKSRESTFLNLYRKKVLSNSMLLKHFNNNLLQYFHFAHENKIYVCDGNSQNLMLEQELIQNDVFVDALTLIVLEKFKCLRILNKIKNVHICYSSIKVLHSFVSSIEYNTYVSGVIEWLKKIKISFLKQMVLKKLQKYTNIFYISRCTDSTFKCVEKGELTLFSWILND